MTDNPFQIRLYNKALQRIGWLNDWSSLVVTPRHMAYGTATITVPSNHRKLDLLRLRGARAVITLQGEFLMSGRIRSRVVELPTLIGEARFELVDDLQVLERMLGWPVPAATNPDGTQTAARDTRTGPAETVVKAFIDANKAHLVDPITVAPNLARGLPITVSARMQPLADVLLPAADAAGIGLTARQTETSIVVDAYVPRVYPHTLRESSGTLISGTLTDSDPTATSTVVGGPGEEAARLFRLRRKAALETEYGFTAEVFTDASSIEAGSQFLPSQMDAAGDETLTAGAAKAGISLGLSQTSVFRYGGPGGVLVGDRVSIDVGGPTLFTDYIREAPLSFTREEGFVATPTVGERTDDPDRRLMQLTQTALRRLRQLGTR